MPKILGCLRLTSAAVLWLAVWTLSGADDQPAAAGQTAAQLIYRVEEPGIAPYLTRTLVTPRYLRIDQPSGDRGFLLFDRAEKTVYSVSPEEENILVLKASGQPLRVPERLELTERGFEPDAGATGKRPRGYELLANGEVCRRVVALPDSMDDAVAALAELEAVLANQQQQTLGAIPEEMQSPCDLETYVYAPARHLRHGLPIEYSDRSGKRELLVDLDPAVEVDADLFSLPPELRRVSLEELRGGAMP